MKFVNLPFTDQIFEQLDGRLIQVLLGPRQVGKTTSLLENLETTYSDDEYIYKNCDSVTTTFTDLIDVWGEAAEGKIVVFDEIQKIGDWPEHIKRLWDENKRRKIKTKCILLGSSSLSLQTGLSESLTGRFELTRAWHWNLNQSKEGYDLDLDQYLLYGGYPGSYEFIKKPSRWQTYLTESIIETVIGKDILNQAHVKSPALFKQAFHLVMSYPAQEISYNKLLGQIQDKGNIDLVKYYLELLEGAFLIKKIFKFSERPLTRKSSSPKIIPLAPALCTYHHLGQINSEYRGRIFESMVGADMIRSGINLSYWRNGTAEVDYVLTFENQLVAVEVKSGRKKSPKGLLEFSKQFPKALPIIISLDNFERFTKDPRAFLKKKIGA